MSVKTTKRPPGAKGGDIAITIDKSLETPAFKAPESDPGQPDRLKDSQE